MLLFMGNMWTSEQYFKRAYASWFGLLKGQNLDGIYVHDDYMCDSDTEDLDDSDDYTIVIKLADGRQYRVVSGDKDALCLVADSTDLTEAPGFYSVSDEPDETGRLWIPIANTRNVEIIDLMPNFDTDERVDGVILIFRNGNVLISQEMWYVSNTPAPLYIKHKVCREVFAAMSAQVRQYAGCVKMLEKHKSGRQKYEKHVFAKLKGREDIARLLGRGKLGFSGNFVPGQEETGRVVVEMTIIVGASSPDVVFDTLNWFCNKTCSDSPKCSRCPVRQCCEFPKKK